MSEDKDERDREGGGTCVCLDVGEHHPDYGRTWCGRERAYRYEVVPLDAALAHPERGGEIEHDAGRVAGVRRRVPTRAWSFVDATHALLCARAGSDGRSICGACAAAMRDALDRGARGWVRGTP